MSYLGNGPEVNAFTIGVDRFSGTGACTEFTLTRDIDDSRAIEVVVGGSQLDPLSAYTVTNGLITFTVAPASGTNNIVVTYRAPVVVTFNQVGTSQITANSVTEGKIAPNAIVGTKIAPLSITNDKMVTGQITGNLIQDGAISGNNIVNNAIRGNNIVAGQVTGNHLGTYSVSGNNLGIGAVSANNFAGGGVTSNVLASNLTISTARISERINIVLSTPTGNYNVHVSNSSVYYFVSNTSGNVTFNLVANDAGATGTTGSLNDLIVTGNSVSMAIALKQGSIRYRANVFIDGITQQALWLSNVQPSYQTSQAQALDMYNLMIIKTGSTGAGLGGGQYTVLVSNSTFGYANGLGMGPSLSQ